LANEAPPASFTGTARFRIIRALGKGASGSVYLAHDEQRGQRLALKVLSRLDALALYRFKQEFRALANVAHRNIAALYELLCDEGRWLLTMEYVDGLGFLDYVRGEDLSADERSELSMSGALTGGGPASSFRGSEGFASEREIAELAVERGPARPSALLRAVGPPRPQAGTTPDAPPVLLHQGRLRMAIRQLVGALEAIHARGHGPGEPESPTRVDACRWRG
jgi:hypothetical protein